MRVSYTQVREHSTPAYEATTMREIPETIEVRGKTFYLFETYTYKNVAEKVEVSLRRALYQTRIEARRGANAVIHPAAREQVSPLSHRSYNHAAQHL